MQEFRLNWLDVTGVRDPFAPGSASALDIADLHPEQPANFMYRSEANLAEWAAGISLREASERAAGLARRAVESARIAAACVSEWLAQMERGGAAAFRADLAVDLADASARAARRSAAQLAIARYVGVPSALRIAEDAPGAVTAPATGAEVAAAATAAAAAAAAAAALQIEARIAAAEALAGERDAPAVSAMLADFGARRLDGDHYREIREAIEAASA